MTLPAIDTLETFGGAKANYAPVEDPTVDEDATHRNMYVANVAALTQTAHRAWVRFVCDDTTPTDPAGYVHGAVWGNDPLVKPAVARASTGVFTVTWPEEVTDELIQTHAVNFRKVDRPNVEGSALYFAQATITAPNVVTVYVFDSSGAADDADGVTISVSVL